jgi:hypothetical protein
MTFTQEHFGSFSEMPPVPVHRVARTMQRTGVLALQNNSLSPVSDTPMAQVENSVLDNFILPSAHFSNQLLNMDEAWRNAKVKPEDSYSYEERILRTYAKNNESQTLGSIARGGLVGCFSGFMIAALLMTPINIVYNMIREHRRDSLQEAEHTRKGWFKYITHGLKRFERNHWPGSIAENIAMDAGFGAFTGIFLSLNQSKQQNTQALALADRMHRRVDEEKQSPVPLKHHAEYHQIPADYEKWQNNVTNWNVNVKDALFFNVITSTFFSILQAGFTWCLLALINSDRGGSARLFKLFRNKVTDRKQGAIGWMIHTVAPSAYKKLKELPDEHLAHIHDQHGEHLRRSILEKYSPLNLARLGILSGLFSLVLAYKNARHLRYVHQQVKLKMLNERATALAQAVPPANLPPIPGEPDVTPHQPTPPTPTPTP